MSIETLRSKLFALCWVELIVIAGIVLLYGWATHERNFIWKDDLTLWSDAAKKSPDKARPLTVLGNIYLKMGLIDRAIKYYEIALGIEPQNGIYQYNIGVIYEKKGMFGKAITAYHKALAINPDNLEALDNLGNTYQKIGQIDKAIEKYKTVLSFNPHFPEAHWNLGIAYEMKGMVKEAIKEWEEYIRLRPDDFEAKEKMSKLNKL